MIVCKAIVLEKSLTIVQPTIKEGKISFIKKFR